MSSTFTEMGEKEFVKLRSSYWRGISLTRMKGGIRLLIFLLAKL